MSKNDRMQRGDVASLRLVFAALVKAGEESLRKAYIAGQTIDALQNMYSLETLGACVDRTAGTVGKYAKLYRNYDSIEDLLEMARRYQTYDVSALCGTEERLVTRYGHQCDNCGSWDTHHRPIPQDAL